MKKINFMKIATVATAIACIISSSQGFVNVIVNKSTTVSQRSVSVSIVSDNKSTSSLEKLKKAIEEDGEILPLCDQIIKEVNVEKDKVDSDATNIAQWADDEIIARQKKYNHEMSVKYSESIEALTKLKNGENKAENLQILENNLSEPEEYHKSDASPSTAVNISDISFVPDTVLAPDIEIISPEPSSDDLKYDTDTVYPEVIKKFAETLGDVNSIYLYVKNSIKYEAYFGSKKSATVTLEQQGGNDIDQATLLIAMLRATNTPARFVGGTVRITTDQAMEITGAADQATAGRILASRYRNITGITNNGKRVGYKMYHTWVEAYIPYTDYRGAGNRSGDKIWVQLDPSFKKINKISQPVTPEYSAESIALQKTVSQNAQLYPDIYDPMNLSPESINYNGIEIVYNDDEYIPNSLPYTVLSVDERYSFVKDSDKASIAIQINGETLFSSPVSMLPYQKINISYEPATNDDKSVLDHYERITDVPAYLVNVVPVVTVGDKKYAGTEAASLGSMQQMITTISSNGETTMLDDSVFCGSMYAINLNLQRISPEDAEAAENRLSNAEKIFEESNACSTDVLGSLLDYAGKYYFSLCDIQSIIYEGVMDIEQTRQLSVAITGYQFHSTSSFGVVKSLDFGAFYIDVAYNKVLVINRNGDKPVEKNFLVATGAIQSFYEGFIWEKLIDPDSTCISTISVFNIAHSQGIDCRYICSSNMEEELSQCNIKESVKNEVRDFINQGLKVEIVPETLCIGDWSGTAYIAMNMDNGTASYMISGGTAGGSSMTVEELYNININLCQINAELACASMIKGAATFQCGVYSGNMKKFVEGTSSLIGGAYSVVSAFQMRYDAMDFIFRYAEEGDECLAEFQDKTIDNIADTFRNCISTCAYLMGGEFSKKICPANTVATFFKYFLDKDYKKMDSEERLEKGTPLLVKLIFKFIEEQLK